MIKLLALKFLTSTVLCKKCDVHPTRVTGNLRLPEPSSAIFYIFLYYCDNNSDSFDKYVSYLLLGNYRRNKHMNELNKLGDNDEGMTKEI